MAVRQRMNLRDGTERLDGQIQHVVGETAGRRPLRIGLPVAGLDVPISVDAEVAFRMYDAAERA